jgi:hypothetical protein
MVTNSEYRAKSGSAVKSLAGSDIACAIRRWSNGSRWCSGNCSTKAAATLTIFISIWTRLD